MKNLFNLLERFSKSLNKDTLAKEAVAQVVFRHTRVNLKPENINLKDGVLEISASPVFKNEINLKESAIKSDLKERHNIFVSRILYK